MNEGFTNLPRGLVPGAALARTFALVITLGASACVSQDSGPRVVRAGVLAPGLRSPDEDTVVGPRHFLHEFPALAGSEAGAVSSSDGEPLVNVVVEIPAGTNAKFEVEKNSGAMRLERIDGQPRIIEFLSYPASYGMVPRTLLAKEDGGDGDPIDVVLLGPARERGEVVPSRLIGVLRLVDRGEVDDKLLAIPADTPVPGFASIRSLEELSARHPKILPILELWFEGYKGEGKIVSHGYASREEAESILRSAIRSYEAHRARRVIVAATRRTNSRSRSRWRRGAAR